MTKIYLVVAVEATEISYYSDGADVTESYYADIEHAEEAFDAVKGPGVLAKLLELSPDESGKFVIDKLLKEVK